VTNPEDTVTRGRTLQRTVASSSPERTFALGVALGRVLFPGAFVGLAGDLGAGKTHFARGVAEGAGVPKSEVSSPTFAIVYPYRGRIPLYHADLYRLADEDELYATGFFDLIGGDGAVLVEWIDQIPSAAPADHLRIRLETTGDDTRTLHVNASGEAHVTLAEAWLTAT
jgi:tRNA threonylcarbamoyladenosine biosynthesis protein TsaE